jgi:Anti-sigma-D factor RsdA to sigma factor binding region
MPDFGRWTSNGGDPSLNEINRTDRFLDALASEQPVYSTDAGEAELAGLLAGWRDEVRDAPVRAALTPRDAAIALDRAAASRHRRRLSMAVVGSVAAAVLCLGGFGAVIAGAGPGDPLYGLRTMLFGEQQQPIREDPVMLASQQLAEVQQLIDEGQWDAAQDKLQTLTTTVATVNDVEQKQELVTQWQELTVKVETKDANATPPPGAPLPVFPDVPVAVAPGSDTTTTTTTSSSETTTTSPSDTTTTSETTSPSETTTPSTPLPTPTPSTPLPTPTPSTPLPTPPPSTYSPLPTPPPSTPLPTPTIYTPIPTPTPLPTPLPTPSAAEQEEEEPATATTGTSQAPPILEAPAPKTVVTTTIVQPEPADEPR